MDMAVVYNLYGQRYPARFIKVEILEWPPTIRRTSMGRCWKDYGIHSQHV